MTDMNEDFFATHPAGKLALSKMGAVPANFRLFEAGWLNDNPSANGVMEFRGAEFRVAKRGRLKGKLAIMVPNTTRTTFVTAAEMLAAEQGNT